MIPLLFHKTMSSQTGRTLSYRAKFYAPSFYADDWRKFACMRLGLLAADGALQHFNGALRGQARGKGEGRIICIRDADAPPRRKERGAQLCKRPVAKDERVVRVRTRKCAEC